MAVEEVADIFQTTPDDIAGIINAG